MANSEPAHQSRVEDDAQKAAIEGGIKSLEAGKTVPYEDVRKWLLSWGSDKELPKPECR